MKKLTLLALALVIFSIAAARSHASIQYTFSGVVPSTASSTIPGIDPGSSWTAVFDINPTAGFGDDNIKTYAGAVTGLTLNFSSGYLATFDASQTSSFLINVYNGGADAVYIYGVLNTFFVRFQAVNTEDNPLDSTALPGLNGNFSFGPAPAQTPGIGYEQLDFTDESGSVYYNSQVANNVSFAAVNTAVPEPMSLIVWTALGGSIAAVYSYRRATK